MTRWSTWLSSVVAILSTLACHDRDSSKLAGRCFAFDSAAFTEVGHDTATGAVAADSTQLIELLSRPHSTEAGAFSVRAHGLRIHPGDSSGREEFSYWRPVGRDSVEIVWREGLYGPVLRLAIRGRTLEGELRQTTDIIGSPHAAQRWRARAREARCSLASRPAA